jgi:hypothetical protein
MLEGVEDFSYIKVRDSKSHINTAITIDKRHPLTVT